MIRRLLLKLSPALQELNGDGTLTPLAAEQQLSVWGVGVYALTDLAGLGFKGADAQWNENQR